MPDYSEHYCDLVQTIAAMHGHKDYKRPSKLVKKRVSNPLDYDQVEELLQQASEELEFVMYMNNLAWLKQNRGLLVFLTKTCETDLWSIGCKFDHVCPPELREEFDMPPPTW